ncbi:pilus assembly protein PilM, partial [Candidatus Parcubacteria bacterium]|nr:pilus assembly protein PilM [Candidatus Parcubacteria bacterium]
MAKSFFDFFPTPQYLSMPSVGLDISERAVRMIEFRGNKKHIQLARFSEELLPSGTIVNGQIKNSEALVKVLRTMKKKFGLKFVAVTLPEEKAYVFKTEIPQVPDDEIREAIGFKIEENVPISGTESVFEFESTRVGDDKIVADVSVVPLAVVTAFTDMLRNAGLVPIAYRIESQAIAKSVIPAGDDRSYLIANIGISRTALSIVSEGRVQFSSTVSVG